MSLKQSPINACPNCSEVLVKIPKRKIRCPHCGKEIFVRSSQKLYSGSLFTKEQVISIDEFYSYLHDATTQGFNEVDFHKMQRGLSKQFGHEATLVDTVWGLYNKLLSQTTDTQKLQAVYYSMALFLNKEGRPHENMLTKSLILSLELYKEQGFTEVKVESSHGCDECCMLHEQKFTIIKAIEECPLPNKKCVHCIYDTGEPFCRCYYAPVSIELNSINIWS